MYFVTDDCGPHFDFLLLGVKKLCEIAYYCFTPHISKWSLAGVFPVQNSPGQIYLNTREPNPMIVICKDSEVPVIKVLICLPVSFLIVSVRH